MSTIKASNIQNGSSASVNIALNTDGSATFAQMPVPPSAYAMRNKIINGAMEIDQRNAGASTTPAASGYLLDRFAWAGSIGSKLTFGQNLNSVTPPSGYSKYLGAQTASATTPGASEFYSLYQVIEGFNITDFAWGTASAKTVTLSFWARSSLTGTFGGSIYNGAANRCYPFSYSLPVANTWTAINITVAGDTTGTWATDNTAGAVIMFGLGAGASVSGAAGAWGSTLYRSSTGAVQVVANASANFYITGVQLEVGSVATPFERRLVTQELAMCQRYYTKGLGFNNAGYVVGSTSVNCNIYFPVTMRAAPTATIYNYATAGAAPGSVTASTDTTFMSIGGIATGAYIMSGSYQLSAEL